MKTYLGFHRNIFFLGLVSFLTDISSEMIFNLLPLFLLNVLKVGTPVIGLIEGIAEGTASLLKVFSGWLSDRMNSRKGLTVLGYGVSALAKPFLYFVTMWGSVAGIRFIDRVGKGIRTSPRDALIADSSSAEEMGKNFGFHRGMDTSGAVIGLAIAALIVYFTQHSGAELTKQAFQLVVIAGTIPAVLAVLMLLFFVKDQKKVNCRGGKAYSNSDKQITGVSRKSAFDIRFKFFIVIIILFSLGNSSDVFIILRAQNLGFSVVHILLLFVLFNTIYAFSAMPLGQISDKLGRKRILILGWAVYSLSYLGFALASAIWQIWILVAIYGLYYGMAEGVARAFIADIVPVERRGTAYGYYHAAVGLSLLPASVIAGWLWLIGPQVPFYFGAGMAIVAVGALATIIKN